MLSNLCPPPPACRARLDGVLARQAQLQQVWDQHAGSSGAAAAFVSSASAAGSANGSVAAPKAAAPARQPATVTA